MPDEKTPEQLEAERVEAEKVAAEAARVASTSPSPDVLAAYNSVLAEKDRALRDALAEAERLRNERAKPPELTPEESSKKFFENPVELIRTEIQKALAPVTQSIASFTTRSRYAELKIEMAQDPRFTDLPKIEKEFDQMMNGQAIDPNVMIGAYYAAYGMVAKTAPQRLIDGGNTGTVDNTNTNTGTPAKPALTIPPHLRPSTPPAPVKQDEKVKRPPLTENERRLMKMNNIATEDEWYALMDASPENVTKTGVK